ncbi:[Pyruvate dehydrogenase (acetyl-transferring)] kinase isozyme 2, partial [Coemansia sp. RSA 2708]
HRNSSSDDGNSALRLTSGFLHRELPVRIGQTIIGLRENPSPYGIRRVRPFKALMDNYTDDLALLVDRTPAPDSPEADAQFVDALRKLKARCKGNMRLLAQGLRELSWAINSQDPRIVPEFLRPDAQRRRSAPAAAGHYYSSTMAYPDLSAPMAYLAPSGKMEMTDPAKWSAPADGSGEPQAPAVPQAWAPNRVCSEFCDEASCHNPRLWISEGTQQCAENQTRRFFDWLYSMNLGTQLLVEDHVAILDYGHSLVQIIQPLEIASRAAHDASLVCERHYGFPAPVVKIIAPKPAVTTTYVPHYLYSMLFQLVKNALRATVEHHRGRRGSMPVVKLIMSSGDEDVAFKISDEGGGIPLSQVDAIWSYLKTTWDPADGAKRNTLSSITFMQRASDLPLFGEGDGLPMVRQIARYFGGDVDLVSMEGVGTDAYLHLSRSRNATESSLDLHTLLEPAVPVPGSAPKSSASTLA